jgi:hypothetical protein
MRHSRLGLLGCLGVGILIAAYASPWFSSKDTAAQSKDPAAPIIAAIGYHNNAAAIANNAGGTGAVKTISQADWKAIASYDKKALDEAQQVDISEMNSYYPGFGDHFKNEFFEGLRLIVDNGNEVANAPAFLKGQILVDRFGDWYEANANAIRNRK